MFDKNDVNGSNGRHSIGGGAGQDHKALIDARNPTSTAHIKKGYLFALLMVISIGTIQFGYSIGSWNTAFEAYKSKSGWDDDLAKKN
jgi:MFS family permease